MKSRRQDILYGVIFGAWCGFIYSFWSQACNWLFLPGIPLSPSQGGSPGGYILLYVFIGGVLGGISSVPAGKWTGVAVGGLAASFFVTISGLFTPAAAQESVSRTLIVLVYTFLPMTVLLLPVAWVIRRGVEAQHIDPNKPYLWGRRFLIPMLLTLGVVVIASTSLYNPDQRKAVQTINQMILESQGVDDQAQLPKIFQTIAGYVKRADGHYALSVTDDIENFMGPQPVGGELSQFLIVADFESGLRFACIFQAGKSQSSYCVNY
jgi:hypothetical protein